jgi:paraquat-inducible protein A
MTSTEHLIICEHCDCVYEKVVLGKHQKTLCVRCGGVLQRYNGLTVEQRLALTFTAAMLWLFANFYPVMSISMKGLKNSATLWDSVLALSQGPITFMAMVAAISIIIAPAFQLVLLIWVLSYALSSRRAPDSSCACAGWKPCARGACSKCVCWGRWWRCSNSPDCWMYCRASACSPWRC